MNVAILMGRLTKKPEIRTTTDGLSIASYTLAVDRLKGEADFINIKAFGKGADFAEKYLDKGMKIAVTGRIQTGSYTNKEGRKVFTFDVVADRQEFCERKAESAPPATTARDDDFVTVPDGIDEELPFAGV